MRDEMTSGGSLSDLDRALREIARQDGVRAPQTFGRHLVAELRARDTSDRARTATGRAVGFGLVMTLAVVLLAVAWRLAGTAPSSPDHRREVRTPFVALPYSTLPAANTQIVRMEVPKQLLMSMGVAPIESFDALSSGTIVADVLVGDDGVARAIRFVRPGRREERPR